VAKNKEKGHLITGIQPGSIAEELELQPGDRILSINDTEIEDIFDYRYLCNDEYLVLGVISGETGEFWEFEIEKDNDEDLGIDFDNGLMSDYRSCHNKCVFCFIDQLPKGMRETLYFKDDDARLSFLQGNYITLTNMSDHDVDRICYYKLSPINISIHTTNPELRCKMLNNRFAGKALEKINRFCEAGIEINGQVVLCKGYNDGAELDRTLNDIEAYLPNLLSISIVPVGLTKFREGLAPQVPFEQEDARKVLAQIHAKQQYFLEKYGRRVVYAGDEWYLKAKMEIPAEEEYEDFPQIENGVGMLRSLINEVNDEIDYLKEQLEMGEEADEPVEFADAEFDVITGYAAYDTIKMLSDRIMQEFKGPRIHVYRIRNDFFGPEITVAGLITAGDIMKQVPVRNPAEDEGREHYIMFTTNMLKSGSHLLLDDLTVEDVENALQKKARIVKSSGSAFVHSFFKDYDSDEFSNELNKYEP